MNNKQCSCDKDKVINDLLKRVSNLEFEVESKEKENERLNNIIKYLEKYFSEREYYEFAQLVRETKKANIEWLEGAVKDYE